MLLYPQKTGLKSIGSSAEQSLVTAVFLEVEMTLETDLRIHTPCWCHILVSGSAFLGWPLQRMGWGLVGETMAWTIWNSFTLSNRVKCLHQPNSTFISHKKNFSDVGWGSRKRRSWNRRVSATFPQNWNSPKGTGIELYGTDNHEKGNVGQLVQ